MSIHEPRAEQPLEEIEIGAYTCAANEGDATATVDATGPPKAREAASPSPGPISTSPPGSPFQPPLAAPAPPAATPGPIPLMLPSERATATPSKKPRADEKKQPRRERWSIPREVNPLTALCLFLSGVDRHALAATPSERSFYGGIGAAVLFTSILGFGNAAYCAFSVWHNPYATVAVGLFYALAVANIDRLMLITMQRPVSRRLYRLLVGSGRILLALLIGFTISRPLELALFQGKIQEQMVRTRESEVNASATQAINDREGRIQSQNDAITQAQRRIQEATEAKNAAEKSFEEAKREYDPVRGSAREATSLAKEAYRRKKEDYIQALRRQLATKRREDALIEQTQKQLQTLNAEVNDQIQRTQQSQQHSDELLDQLEALWVLERDKPVVFWAALLITAVIMIIDLFPFLVKSAHSAASTKPYEAALLRIQEEDDAVYQMERQLREKDREIAKDEELLRLQLRQSGAHDGSGPDLQRLDQEAEQEHLRRLRRLEREEALAERQHQAQLTVLQLQEERSNREDDVRRKQRFQQVAASADVIAQIRQRIAENESLRAEEVGLQTQQRLEIARETHRARSELEVEMAHRTAEAEQEVRIAILRAWKQRELEGVAAHPEDYLQRAADDNGRSAPSTTGNQGPSAAAAAPSEFYLPAPDREPGGVGQHAVPNRTV